MCKCFRNFYHLFLFSLKKFMEALEFILIVLNTCKITPPLYDLLLLLFDGSGGVLWG